MSSFVYYKVYNLYIIDTGLFFNDVYKPKDLKMKIMGDM
jgi:hypothetical protein